SGSCAACSDCAVLVVFFWKLRHAQG
ncbi:hypothetical protein A2U01_0115199, partial [Trifolium medium]|nr:hypothetical protein [Trifolium medium]